MIVENDTGELCTDRFRKSNGDNLGYVKISRANAPLNEVELSGRTTLVGEELKLD